MRALPIIALIVFSYVAGILTVLQNAPVKCKHYCKVDTVTFEVSNPGECERIHKGGQT